MKEKERNRKRENVYPDQKKSNISDINRRFIWTVDIVASIELFEEYVYAKRHLRRLEKPSLEEELFDKFIYIDDIIVDFKHILDMEGVLKSKKIFELYQIKKILLNYYEEYRFLSSYAHHIYRMYTYRCNKNDRYRRKYNLDSFYSDLYNSLKDRDNLTLRYIQQEIMSVIPMRVTKDFLFGYLKNSLTGRIGEDPDGALEIMTDIYGIVNEDFYENVSFSDNIHFKRLKEYANLDYKGMSRRKLRIYCNELNRYAFILDTVCEVIWSYIMSSNRIMMILLDFDIDYASLVEMEPLVSSAYRYAVNWDKKGADAEGKILFHQIRLVVRKWYDVLKRCSVKIEDMDNLNFEGEDMVTKELVDFINYFYYLNLVATEDEDSDAGDYNDISSDDLYAVLNDIIYDIDLKLGMLKPDERRLLISDVISSVDPDFKNLNDFIGFVKKSVEFDTTDAEKAFTIKNINDILDRYRFLD